MKKMRRFLSVCCLAVGVYSAQADNIIVGADSWSPFNGEAGSANPGYMIEIAEKIFKDAGHKLVYKNMPWSRAIAICRKGKINGIVGAAQGDAKDFVFPEEPLGMLLNSFFVLSDSSWKYQGTESLVDQRIGTITDYDYGPLFTSFVKENPSKVKVEALGGDEPLRRNMLKLKAGRLDSIIEASAVFEYTAKELKMSGDFKNAGSDSAADPLYIAFSPLNPKSKEYAKILSDGILRMRRSGELARILAKYGQKDWK